MVDVKDWSGLTQAERGRLIDAIVRHSDAEMQLAQAQAREKEATSLKTEREISKLELETVPVRIAAEQAERKRQEELALNKYHHVYAFNDSVGATSVKSCIEQLAQWQRLESGCEIEIVFNSPGGSIIDGLALFDYIQHIRISGHIVTTSTIGYAASMAGILLQAGTKRVMGRQSWLLIHEAAFGAGGKIGEVEDTVDWVKRIQQRILDIFAERCQATNAPHKLTRRQIETRWRRKDWWINADEALGFGLIDAVGPHH